MNWQQYIHSDPEVLLGKPVVKGTRISVEMILELLSEGWTHQQILESYPALTPDHLQAIYAYLREGIGHELYHSISFNE